MRKAKRLTTTGLPGDVIEIKKRPRKNNDLLVGLRKRSGAITTIVLLVLVIWVGAEIAYTSGRPTVEAISRVATVWIKRGVPTVAPTWTPTVTPTPTRTPTPTPVSIPPAPKWFTSDLMTKYAGIVIGETWSITDTKTLEFLATQVMYDAFTYRGRIPASRWKAYGTATHDALQAVNVALINALLNTPRWPRCEYVGGFYDSDYFKRVSVFRVPDYTFGSNDKVVLGWGCIPKEVKQK